MSSTNRTNAKARHISDYYVTPQWCIVDFMNAWIEDLEKEKNDFLELSENLSNIAVLDPCAGGDSFHAMSYPDVLINKYNFDPNLLDTVDVREDSLAATKYDFLNLKIVQDYDLVITNPPFNLAMEFIKKSLNSVQEGGYVVMLLRLNFLGTKLRKPFLQSNMPKWIYVHNRRMSFTDDNKTDSIEYMHAVWQKGYNPKHSLIRII